MSGLHRVHTCLLFLFVCVARPQASPNVVVFFTDDQGYADLSIQGHPTIFTPNIDQIAMEGIRFTQWYSSGSSCSPSRAALLTGRLPVRSGTAGRTWEPVPSRGGQPNFNHGSVGGLPLNETTIPEALKRAGYDTAMIGKWHLGQRNELLPPNHGFDYYYGIPFSHDMGQSFWNDGDVRTPIVLVEGSTIVEQPVNFFTLTQRYTDRAIQFITKPRANPFFLYMAYQEPHTPMFCSPDICGASPRGAYGDMMLSVDNSVGQIMKSIQQAGIDDDTLVFFVSDNGPWLQQGIDAGSAGLFRQGKGTTWEGGVRVPAMARWPGHIHPGRLNDENFVSTLDIFPTLMALAGQPLPSDRDIDGIDIAPILLGSNGDAIERGCLFFYQGQPDPVDPINRPGLWAMRCGKWKAHFVTQTEQYAIPDLHDPPLIYNIEMDPSEAFPLDINSQEYIEALGNIEPQRVAHLAVTVPGLNQMALGDSEELIICCEPNSQTPYPQFPVCTCNPENWNPEEVPSKLDESHLRFE